jgi:serine O-acetyltransferase
MHMVLKFHRAANFFEGKKLHFIAKSIWIIMRIIFACDMGVTAKIGKGVGFFHNGLGCVIHPRTEIGDNTKIYQNVTIGGNGRKNGENGVPVIGCDVFIGAGAVLVGPIRVGDGAVIGANTVVTRDVPAGFVIGGSPAKVLRKNLNDDT